MECQIALQSPGAQDVVKVIDFEADQSKKAAHRLEETASIPINSAVDSVLTLRVVRDDSSLYFLGGFSIISSAKVFKVHIQPAASIDTESASDLQAQPLQYLTTIRGIPYNDKNTTSGDLNALDSPTNFNASKVPLFKALCVIPGGPKPVVALQIEPQALQNNSNNQHSVFFLHSMPLTARLADHTALSAASASLMPSASPMSQQGVTQSVPMIQSARATAPSQADVSSIPFTPVNTVSFNPPLSKDGTAAYIDPSALMTSSMLSWANRSNQSALHEWWKDKGLPDVERSISSLISGQFRQQEDSFKAQIEQLVVIMQQQQTMIQQQSQMMQRQQEEIQALKSTVSGWIGAQSHNIPANETPFHDEIVSCPVVESTSNVTSTLPVVATSTSDKSTNIMIPVSPVLFGNNSGIMEEDTTEEPAYTSPPDDTYSSVPLSSSRSSSSLSSFVVESNSSAHSETDNTADCTHE
jgi:hypothetical protein